MKEVLENSRLVSLQREGGATLARFRREDLRLQQSEDSRYTDHTPRTPNITQHDNVFTDGLDRFKVTLE